MSSPKVWRSMWEATGKLAGKLGLGQPIEGNTELVERPVTRCPHCEQKLRYASHRAGKSAKCPRCASPFTLPIVARPVFPKFKARVGYSEIRERL